MAASAQPPPSHVLLKDDEATRHVVEAILGEPMVKLMENVPACQVVQSFRGAPHHTPMRSSLCSVMKQFVRDNRVAEMRVLVKEQIVPENTVVAPHSKRVGYMWETCIYHRHRLQLVMMLMAHNPDYMVSYERKRGQTPLHYAIANDASILVVNYLVKFARTSPRVLQADVHAEDNEFNTPLCIAITSDKTSIVRAILHNYPEALQHVTHTRHVCPHMTMLAYAAARGSVNCARCILNQKDVDVNAAALDGLPPLHVAVQYGLCSQHTHNPTRFADMVWLLIKNKADVNILSSVNTLREHWANMHVLHLCASGTRTYNRRAESIVRCIISCPDIDINVRTQNGVNTPLLMAARNSSYGVARVLLVEGGAAPFLRNNRGKDVFDYVCLDLEQSLEYSYGCLANKFREPEYLKKREEILPFVQALAVPLYRNKMSLMHRPMHRNVKHFTRKIFMDHIFWHRDHHIIGGGMRTVGGPRCAAFAAQTRFQVIMYVLCVCHRLQRSRGRQHVVAERTRLQWKWRRTASNACRNVPAHVHLSPRV